ncbi:ABC transporter ATP-binding protein [Desulfofalx alkaliphila]|uniref:ABC transporter ATP-binding protein n=1 Tax=Desulfofalx alkaliphila TaxID=105483 RepID=UPI0004E166C6|nr:ABC transporter ATP-binding protein [Desulfofalx alkaliphila]
MDSYAIKTTELSKKYKGKTVVSGLDLSVPKESVFAFLGPNGAGKTTTIKMLLGLIKPSAGKVWLLGQGVDDSKVRQRVGYVPDNPEFYGYLNALDLVRLCKSLYSSWDDGLVEKIFHLMDIPKKTKAKHLSRGQKAAIALALAMGPRPDLIILDEPATQFDPVKRQAYYSLLFEDVVAAGGTVFLATHQLSEVERFADYAAFINRGKLLTVKPVAELVLSEKRIRVVFQGEAPDDIERWTGVRRVERQGKSYMLTVTENVEDIYQRLQQLPHFALELIDMDLEDIFLEHAGDRRVDR